MSFQSPYPRPDLEQATGPQCPACHARAGKKVTFSWWGGIVGPGVMSLHKCQACGCQFNSKTGKPARNAIIAYVVIVNVILLLVLALLFWPH